MPAKIYAVLDAGDQVRFTSSDPKSCALHAEIVEARQYPKQGPYRVARLVDESCPQRVVVSVVGGVAFVQSAPDNVTVEIHDYDNGETDPDALIDAAGDRYVVS